MFNLFRDLPASSWLPQIMSILEPIASSPATAFFNGIARRCLASPYLCQIQLTFISSLYRYTQFILLAIAGHCFFSYSYWYFGIVLFANHKGPCFLNLFTRRTDGLEEPFIQEVTRGIAPRGISPLIRT